MIRPPAKGFQPLEALIPKASQGFNDVKLLDRLLKRKNPGVKNPVFVEAGRRGGIKSGQVRRARAEQRRSMEAEASPTAATVASDTIHESFTGDPTEVAERVKALLETPMEPGSLEPIEATTSPSIQVEPTSVEETKEEAGAPENSALSSPELTLEAPDSDLSDIRRLLPSQQHVEKAMEELEYIKNIFEIPYTLSILEKLSNRSAGKVRASEESEKGVEVSKEEATEWVEEIKRMLRPASQ